MSNYDPFRLYSRQKTSSHKGQVLRKKFYPVLGDTYTREDLNRVIAALTAQGYQVYFPGVSPPSPPKTILHGTVGTFDIGEISFPSPAPSELSFSFSTLWNAVEPEFSEILDVDPSSISNFEFRLDIISINSWGSFTAPSYNDKMAEISLYFQDSAKAITYMTSSDIKPGYQNHVSMQSLDNQKVLNLGFVYDSSYTQERSKMEGLDSSFLMSYIETDPTIIVALKNKDYSVFNPVLFNFVYHGSQPLPLTIPNNVACFHIYLEYDTK